MIKPKIALVVKKKEDLEAYLAYLQSFDIDLSIVTSFKELEKILSIDSCNGIIVDLKTKLSVPREQKALAYDLLDHYPVLQSRIMPDADCLQTMPFGKTRRDVSLESFLTEECLNFAARKIRSTIRRRLHFNVLLSKTGDVAAGDLERTVTLNVSKEGCYIITPSTWGDHASVAFIINELDAKSPVKGEIRWGIVWGRTMRIPGIGVKFEDIHTSQHQELVQKYNLH